MKTALMRMDILESLRRHRLELERLSVKTIALFGSYAKDAQTDSSDLDFVVEFSAPTYDNFWVESIRVPQISEDIKRTLVHV